jgi:hypothetical protein
VLVQLVTAPRELGVDLGEEGIVDVLHIQECLHEEVLPWAVDPSAYQDVDYPYHVLPLHSAVHGGKVVGLVEASVSLVGGCLELLLEDVGEVKDLEPEG